MKTSHYIVENLNSSLKITITNPRPRIQIFICGVMLVFIAIVLPSIFPASSLFPISIFTGGVFALWEVWGFFYFLRLLFGKEIIEVSKDFFIVSSNLFSFAQTKRYPSESIQSLRVLPNPYAHEYKTWPRSDIWWDKGDGLISLQLNSRKIQIGRWLDEVESQEIVDIIQKSFPQYHK